MKGLSRTLLGMTIMAVLPAVAGAAGTYYNGNLYQNPQARYGANYGNNGGGFYNNYGAGRGYGQNMRAVGTQQGATQTATTKAGANKKTTDSRKQGFQLGAGVAHEFANWDFRMKTAGSELHYDNLRWNIIEGEAAYYFGDSTKMQVKVGGRYGTQYGESAMIDDDITKEALWTVYSDGTVQGTPALSAGTSKDGNQMGFNASFGLTDFFKAGRVKFTPSIGYRYLKYKVETKNNYGLMVEVLNSPGLVNCLEVQPGEIQCSPYVGFSNDGWPTGYAAGFAVTDDPATYSSSAQTDIYGNTVYILLNDNNTFIVENYPSANQLDLGSTYYYEQSGVSHSYETEWAGPYLALDMEYEINNNNTVSAGVEFGLPIYKSKGDQPYRVDWAHPTSVEDKGELGDAYHLGFNAMWSTALGESTMLSLGMTYDYYSIKSADATTYLNPARYQDSLDNANAWIVYLNSLGSLTDEQADLLESWKAEKAQLEAYRADGWAMKSANEIESIYKSMGLRLGINVKF